MPTYSSYLTLLLYLLLLAAQPISAQDAVPTAGLPQCPAPPFVWSKYYASPTFAADQTVFALARLRNGVLSSLFRSTDGGRTWSLQGEPTLSENTLELALSQQYATDHTLYAITGDSRLTRSTDAGATWLPPIEIPMRRPLYGAKPAVIDANTLFLGLYGGPPPPANQRGLFLSTDTGATWEQRFDLAQVNEVALSPRFAEDQTVFIGARIYKTNYGIYKSTDAGRTWVERNDNLYLSGGTQCQDIVFSPGFRSDRTLFAVCTGLGFRSTDAGDTWRRVYPPQDQDENHHIFGHQGWTLSPAFVTDRSAWLDYGLLLTTDAGNTWEEHPRELMMYTGLAAVRQCSPTGACGVVLVGGQDNGGIFYSYDLGRTWHCPQEEVTPPWERPTPIEVREPAAWLLLGSGLAALAGWARRR